MAVLMPPAAHAQLPETPDYPGLRAAIDNNYYPLWYREIAAQPPVSGYFPYRFSSRTEMYGQWLSFFEHDGVTHGPLTAFSGSQLAMRFLHEGVHAPGNVDIDVSYAGDDDNRAVIHALYINSGNDPARSFTLRGPVGSVLNVGRLMNGGANPLLVAGDVSVQGYNHGFVNSVHPERYYTIGDGYHLPSPWGDHIVFKDRTSFEGWVGGTFRPAVTLPAWQYDERDNPQDDPTGWAGFFSWASGSVNSWLQNNFNVGLPFYIEDIEENGSVIGGPEQVVFGSQTQSTLEFLDQSSMKSERIYGGNLIFRGESTLLVNTDGYIAMVLDIQLPPAVHDRITLHDDAVFTARSNSGISSFPVLHPTGLPPGGSLWNPRSGNNAPEIFATTARITLNNRSKLLLKDPLNFEPSVGVDEALVEAKNTAEVKAEGSYAVNSGRLIFRDNSYLTGTAVNAITGGRQQFFGGSRLRGQAGGLVLAGEQVFYDSALLVGDTSHTVVGGLQYFHGGALQANAANAVSRGEQRFVGSGTLEVTAAGGISGGVQKFGVAPPSWTFPQGQPPVASAAEATLAVADAIVGGTQEFRLASALNLEHGGALSGGEQFFFDTSELRLDADGALSGGEQFFFDTSELRLDADGAVVGGTQEFYEESVMIGNHPSGYGGAGARFYENSSLDLQARDVLAAGTTEFRGSSTLEANSTFAYAGNQTAEFFNTSAFRAHQPDSLYGGLVNFRDLSRLLVFGANAVSGGEQRFHTQAKLEVTNTGAIGGGSQIFLDNSRLEAKTADAIAGGVQSFAGSAKLLAQVDKAIMHGTQLFTGNSSLESSGSGGVTGGTQIFIDNSTLQASTGFAVRGGTQTFRGSAVLVGSASNAVAGGDQVFEADSRLQLTSASAVTGGSQTFSGFARLDVAAAQAIAGGTQEFLENSRMDATAADAVIGLETLVFRGTTALAATQSNAITGGNITFYDNARLLAQAAQAVNGGTQEFFGTSGLTTSISQGLRGGTQNFRDTSVLLSSAERGITGGTQHFHNSSRLRLTAGNAVTAGLQLFYNTSSLSLEAANGIQLSGNQRFYNNSHLTITAGGAGGLRGGIQEFYGFSEMRVDGNNGVGGSSVTHFYDQSRLLARDADTAINGGTQNFNDNSELVMGFSRLSGGTQNFRDDSILRAGGSTISGGTQNFYHRSKAITSGGDSITTSSLNLHDFSTLEVTSTNSLRRPTITLHHSSRIEIKANLGINAGTGGTHRVTVGFADPDEFGPGGTLQLGGFSISLGTLESVTPGAGIVENRNPDAPATLTVSPPTSGGKDSVFSGLIRDGFNGGTPGFPVVPSAPLTLAKTGPLALILEGNNTFSGGVAVSAGSVVARHDNALGSGTVSVSSGATLRLEQDRTIANDISNKGSVVAAGGTATLEGLVFGNAGSFTGVFVMAGVLSPGESPGIMTFNDDLTLAPENNLLMEIGGLVRGPGYDGLNVTGTLNLGGTLTLVAMDDFEPAAGDIFQLFQAGTLQGAFTSVDVSQFLTEGLTIDLEALESLGQLIVTESTPVNDPLGDWRQQFFGSRENVGEAADDYDVFGDGMVNLLRFSLGGTPNTPATELAPVTGQVEDDGDAYAIFKHRRRAGEGTGTTVDGFSIDGVTYTIEVSENLLPPWQTGPGVLREPALPVDNGDGTVTVTVQILPALGNGPPSRFVRLRVTREGDGVGEE